MIRKLTLVLGIVLAGALLSVDASWAQDYLSQEALFYRCYGQLTQSRPARSSALLAQVRAGTKSAAQACTEVLDSARFTAGNGTQIGNPNDAVAKAVLYSLHQLHRSWAREQGLFNPIDNETLLGSEPWFDDSPYGSYVTRALFSPNVDVQSIVQGTDYPQPVRVTMDPAHSYRGVPNTVLNSERDWRLGAQHPFAPQGDLLGVRTVNIPRFMWTRFGDLGSMPNFPNIGVPPTASQAIADVNFPDINSVKGPLAETTQFGVWINGQLQVPTAGSYTLFIDIDDGGMLYIDGTRLLDKSVSGTTTEYSVVRNLTAGSHALQIRYRQRSGAAKLIFSWQGPTFPKEVVPASALSNLTAAYYIGDTGQEVNLTGNEGGGFIGNHNYLMTTFTQDDRNYVPDGLVKTNRSWARAVIHDAFCRDIPVVQESDVADFVIPASDVPFRQQAACNACHASVDRQAGLIRNLRWNAFLTVLQDSPAPDLYGLLGVRMISPTMNALTTWPDTADTNYAVRRPYGHLFFRNYRGELIDRVVQSIEELGSAVKDQDDYYACFAKRYYQYFLGIDVDLGDPTNPAYRAPNRPDAYHRGKVIALGLQLKNHKSLRQLILDIINSDEYRMADFGVTYAGPN